MSITDDDLETTNSAIAKLEGIEPSGDISEFNARKLICDPTTFVWVALRMVDELRSLLEANPVRNACLLCGR